MNRLVISALITSTLVLSACADDDDDLVASPSKPSAATPSATPTPTGALLDSAFGTAGIVKAALVSGGKDRFNAVAVGKDGKIYAAGLTSEGPDQKIAVARFSTDGAKDTSFGDGGVASVNVSPNSSTDPTAQIEQARSLVFLEDGTVVAVGVAEHDATAEGAAAKDSDIVAVAFDSAGKPKSGFGTDGVARFDLGTGHLDGEDFVGADQGWGSAALPDGDGLVIFGTTTAGADRADGDFVLLGVDDDGKLDDDFGDDGVLKVGDRPQVDNARHVQVVGDKLVATGYSRYTDGDKTTVRPVLIRASLDGELDKTFDDDGIATYDGLGAVAESYQFGVQGDKYVLTGYGKANDADKVDLIAYRFNNDGEFDTTFGDNGVTRIDITGEDDRGRNLVVAGDKIVYVGSGKVDGSNQEAMVVVLDKDGKRDAAYGADGVILTDLGTPGDAWFGAALAPDGKTIYLAGYTNISNDSVTADDAVLGRLTLS
ncbi:hypothetical protein GCM10009547_48810 [Sporichthya brevicatena]|uniref:Uncharacterized protein n=1 Tax=Sporichthya brevicatena TaxID=171442 RepID=A0ABN1HD03_9ACTN